MSDLNLGPTQHSSPLKGILTAFVVLAVVAAAVFYFNPRKTAELSITKVQLHAEHTTFSSQRGSVNVIGQPASTEDDFYVVATVRLENKLHLPIFIDSFDATYTAPDNTTLDTKATSLTDISRIEETFPALQPLIANPLSFDPGIAPGTATEGTILLHFSGLTEDAWKARKSATLTVNLAHQNPVTTTLP